MYPTANRYLLRTSIIVTLLQLTQKLLSLEQITLPCTCIEHDCLLSNTWFGFTLTTLGYRNDYFHFTAAGTDVKEELAKVAQIGMGELGLKASSADTKPSVPTIKLLLPQHQGTGAPIAPVRPVKERLCQEQELRPWQRSWGRRLGTRKGGIKPQESLEILEHLPPNQSLPTFCFVLSPTPLTLWGAVSHYLSLKKELTYSSS